MERSSCRCKNVRIVEGIFGKIVSENGEASDNAAASTTVKSYKMSNNYGTEVILITWGATIVSIKCHDKYGDPGDIVLGFDNLDSYLDPRLSQGIGSIVGRCSAQAKDSEAEETGNEQQDRPDSRAQHTGPHRDDGENEGSFGHRLWESHVEDECRVVMSYLSPDGEDGYPGALLTSVKFELTRCNSLEIAMRAVSTKPTKVNLSHGCIFNLAGHASGPDELRAHELSLNCDRWIEQRGSEAALRPVAGTGMDLRVARPLGQLIDQLAEQALEPRYFGIARGAAASLQPSLNFASRILHRKTGRYLEVYSDQPGLQFCAGGQLPAPAALDDGSSLRSRPDDRSPSSASSSGVADGQDVCPGAADKCDCDSQDSSGSQSATGETIEPLEFLAGKCGARYTRFGGFSLLPQNRPRSLKIKSSLFPSATLRPGQVYYHDLVYKFGVDLDNYCLS